ncbi:MAG TPA: SIS domain-containing protein [Hellea balneolensis]|uniref:SIS domain-containing protein n=1 Tax=Hellea balneolensis TaxID=287478 RepID=A0A7C5LRM2_9PROT|nr:SIS domain-containing protein [Hellea balneolensis]
MFKEASEAAGCVQTQLKSNSSILADLATRLVNAQPAFVVTCARGSSDHAATYAKYLIETRLGIPTLSAAPSISSVYGLKTRFAGALFLAISQSGESPDILSAASLARDAGALTVALVNNLKSPLAQICDFTIALHAGIEQSVPATKTFICTLSAMAQLVEKWTGEQNLSHGLDRLPQNLQNAYAHDWSEAVNVLKHTTNLFVVSRGLGYGIAQEAALKFKEVCGIHAESFSAAEVKHGPMALVKPGFPVLIFSHQGKVQKSIDSVARMFLSRNAQIISVGKPYQGALNLPSTSGPCEALWPILNIQSFYKFANALSLARGLNPDVPPYLNKITETV